MKEVKINNELKTLLNNWNKDFKGDLLESIEEDIENGCTLKESINLIVNECFPIWIEEANGDKELINLYESYLKRFKEVYKTL